MASIISHDLDAKTNKDQQVCSFRQATLNLSFEKMEATDEYQIREIVAITATLITPLSTGVREGMVAANKLTTNIAVLGLEMLVHTLQSSAGKAIRYTAPSFMLAP